MLLQYMTTCWFLSLRTNGFNLYDFIGSAIGRHERRNYLSGDQPGAKLLRSTVVTEQDSEKN
jgi:hypothetical protein